MWYHFNNKRALLEAIAVQFVQSTDERLKILPREGQNVIDEYAVFLRGFAAELNEFRFLYRDQADYGEHGAALQQRLPSLYRETQDQILAFLRSMREQEILVWPEDRLEDLVVNATIVLRYGLEYFRESGRAATEEIDPV